MPIILPWMCFSLLWLAFVGRSGLRQGFVYAAVVYALCLVVATETLSVWNVLQFETLLAWWAGLTVLSALYLWWYGDRQATGRMLHGAWMAFRGSWVELSAVVVILATVLMIAVVAPSNTWESMAYRMARVMMWIQQGSVSHYPTSYLAQLFSPPFVEWNVLHFQILSGSDRFANTVEWLALGGCGIGASLIARELKQTFPVQVLAAVIAVTLPMGLLQGSSTQSNLAASFWLMTFALCAMQYVNGPSACSVVCGGLSLGLALLSKGVAYPVALPLAATLFLYGMSMQKGYRPRVKLACAAVVIVVVAMALNGGHYARNWDLFGHPVHPGPNVHSHVNEQINVSVLWSNLVRNSALHWGVPSDRINDVTLGAVRRLFGDTIDTIPGTTLGVPLFQAGIPFRIHESFTGNFLHFWFLAASLCGVLLFGRRFQASALTVFFALAVAVGAFSFCGLLQWEQWNSRYHTPLFMLGAPIVATFVAQFCSSVKPWSRFANTGSRCVRIVAATFFVLSIPWVIAHELRPLYAADGQSIFSTDRREGYFKDNPMIFQPYVDSVNFIAAISPREVGLYAKSPIYEYPLWVLLKERLSEMPRLEYVGVRKALRDLREGNVAPPLILSNKGHLRFREVLEGETYVVVKQSFVGTSRNPELTVLAKADIATGIFEKFGGKISTESERLIRSGDFEVYLDRKTNSLVYVKNSCRPSKLQPPAVGGDSTPMVFVHLIPVDADDLPDDRKPYGFDNLDFRFNEFSVFSPDGRCTGVRRLPDYDVARLRTGEYVDDDRLWEAEVSFDE